MGAGAICCCSLVIFLISWTVLASLFADAKRPRLSIVDFSVPALNKTLNETTGDIYLDLKFRNRNKVISLYYDDPFSVVISYFPLEDPYQKYVWEYPLQPFFQGNGKTKNIRTFIGQPSSKDVVVGNKKENTTTGKVVSFRIDLVVSYQYNYWVKGDVHTIETFAEVLIDVNTGERVAKDKIKLKKVASDDQAVGRTYKFLLDGLEEASGGGSGGEDDNKKKKN